MQVQMQVAPYLFFDGRCEEAIAFYRGVLGAEVTMLMRAGSCRAVAVAEA
jgi:uncharacterized glyoxalase superfamily protein PhnB